MLRQDNLIEGAGAGSSASAGDTGAAAGAGAGAGESKGDNKRATASSASSAAESKSAKAAAAAVGAAVAKAADSKEAEKLASQLERKLALELKGDESAIRAARRFAVSLLVCLMSWASVTLRPARRFSLRLLLCFVAMFVIYLLVNVILIRVVVACCLLPPMQCSRPRRVIRGKVNALLESEIRRSGVEFGMSPAACPGVARCADCLRACSRVFLRRCCLVAEA